MHIVYALVDPRTNLTRYIGKSSSGLNRAKSHFEPGRVAGDTNRHKAGWIGTLTRVGMRPLVHVLEECADDATALLAEIRWIAHGRAAGWPLTNLTAGGDGASGYHPTAETRAKLSAARRRRKLTPEAKAKISAAKLGKPRPDLAAWHKTPAGVAHAERLREMSPGRERQDLAARNGSQEQRDAVSRALKGRKFSDETIAKMRAGQQRRWAKVRALTPK